MTHDIVVFKPDSNRILLVEKTINPTHEVHLLTHKMTHDLTHDFTLRSFKFSLHTQDNNSIIGFCKKELQLLIYRFFSLFHTATKNNIVAFLCSYYLLAMAYSLRSNFITFKSVAL